MSPEKRLVEAKIGAESVRGGAEGTDTLTWRRALIFGAPACALAGPNFLVQSYFLNFATDVLLLAPVAVGMLLAGTRVWDAVSDPAVGFLSDRTQTRFGRRRPWLFVGAPLAAAMFFLLWSPPLAFGSAGLTIWSGVCLIGFATAATSWNIPHNAFGAELGNDPHARSKIYGIRYMCVIGGVAGSFGVMQLIVNAQDPRAAAGTTAFLIALGMSCLLVIPPLFLREPGVAKPTETVSFVRSLRAVAGNAQARRLIIATAAEDMAMTSQGAVAPYMAVYVLERSDLIGLIPAFYIGPMVLSVPFWIAVTKRFGKANVWNRAQWASAISYGSLFTLEAGELPKALVLLALAGFFSGCGGPMGPSMIADEADADAHLSGAPKQGMFFAVWLFLQKTSGALVVLLIGSSLSLAGFVPNEPLDASSDFAIRACLGIAPAAMLVMAAFALRRYRREADL